MIGASVVDRREPIDVSRFSGVDERADLRRQRLADRARLFDLRGWSAGSTSSIARTDWIDHRRAARRGCDASFRRASIARACAASSAEDDRGREVLARGARPSSRPSSPRPRSTCRRAAASRSRTRGAVARNGRATSTRGEHRDRRGGDRAGARVARPNADEPRCDARSSRRGFGAVVSLRSSHRTSGGMSTNAARPREEHPEPADDAELPEPAELA